MLTKQKEKEMKKISILIFLAGFLISCSSDCDCRKNKMKAKYKINNSTGETMVNSYQKDTLKVNRDSIKRMKMRKMRKKWRKMKMDSIKN